MRKGVRVKCQGQAVSFASGQVAVLFYPALYSDPIVLFNCVMRKNDASKPMAIGSGLGNTRVGSSGTMPRQLVPGSIEEHALVVSVEGPGGVLIVGCGHDSSDEAINYFESREGQAHE